MGTTLGNIHIYGQISDTLIDALAEQYCISTSCANWISLYSMDFQNPEWLCAETARISNMVSAPVLAFYCFDDDAATVTLYKNGNNMAECGCRFAHKMRNFCAIIDNVFAHKLIINFSWNDL